MKLDEAKDTIKALKKQGLSDSQIQYSFTRLYLDNKFTFDQYNGMINLLGYHFEDEFINMSDTKRKQLLKKQLNIK